MRRFIVLLCLGALFLGLTANCAFAQGANGSIGGTITDPAGARIPGAKITAVNVGTNVKYASVSTDTGDYQVLLLPPGTYDVNVEANGFKQVQRKAIQVQVSDRLAIHFSMEVGSLAETVMVTSEAPLLRTEDAQVGQVIDSLMIQNLPQINRNPLDLMRLAGNVSGSGKAVITGDPWGSTTADTTINGGRTSGAEYMVDGASIMTGKAHAAAATAIPSMETVAEFKVITNGISAEYGRASGGVVELATKSGTNALHGQAFEYFWNEHFNANSWQNNTLEQPKGAFHRNDYGFIVGGPVFLPKVYNGKNKTFFLFDFEQAKFRQAGTAQSYMAPTDAEREGDMTNMLYGGSHAMMWDPLGQIGKDADGNFVKLTPLGGDGMHIPESRMDPAAKRVMSYLPHQNRTPTPGYSDANAYVGTGGKLVDTSTWDVRLDQNFSEKHHVYARLKQETYQNVTRQWYDALGPDDGLHGRGARTATISWNYTINPTTILTVRGSTSHNPTARQQSYDFNMADWEFDPLVKSLQRNIPNVNWHTWNANTLGWGDMLNGTFNLIPSADNFTNGTVSAAVSKIYSKHTIKTGFETRRYYDNHYEDFPATMNYTGVAVAPQNFGDPTWSNGNTGFANTWGGFLLGIPDSASKTALYTMANSSNYYAAYVQDDIKLTSRLTVNLGVRWDMETPMTERHNKLFAWDPDAPSAWGINSGWNWNDQLTKAGLTGEQIASLPTPGWVKSGGFPKGAAFYAGTQEHPGRTMQGYHPWHFAPRLGAAYQITPKTVVRGSFALMYLTTTGNYWASWVSGADSVSSSVYDRNPLTGNIDHNHANLWYPSQYIKFSPENSQLNRTLGSQIGTTRMISTKADMPREYTWSFSIQRQLPASTLLDLTYSGNHSGTLLATQRTSVFPASLIQPQYYSLFTKMVDNPVKGQVQNVGLTTGDQIPLGYMMMSNPLFGGVEVDGNNIGRSNYNALNLKFEKRLSHGVAFLLAYTFSKALDNVGGVDRQAYKPFQSYQTVADVYGYSPIDETHRLSFYHDIQVPLGKGRRLLGSPNTVGGKILDKIVGGWEYAGTALIRSGRPFWFGPSQANQFENAGVPSLWGRMVGDPANPNYKDDQQVLRSAGEALTGVGRFNPASFVANQQKADFFVLSNISPVYNGIRQPGSASYDGSLMKSFPMLREGTFLQIRMEAENLFNIRGFGNYNTQYDSPGFGYINAVCGTRESACAASPERKIQLSARFVF